MTCTTRVSEPEPHGAIQPAPSDSRLVVQLLSDALSLFDVDRATARERIVSACALARNQGSPKPAAGGKLTPWQFRKAERFIDDALASKVRIKQIAGLLDISSSYLSRAFKATAGISYSDYVTEKRIELAKLLLLTTDTPICEIALLCGLADQSHLTRIFSRWVGLPPNAWRRQVLSAGPEPIDRGSGGSPPQTESTARAS